MKRVRQLAPSILAADFMRLGEQVAQVEAGGAEYLHFDVMDGLFVPPISFGMPVLQSLRRGTKLFLDVHLMIERPERYISDYAELGADSITVHYEACTDPERAIRLIHDTGKRVGIAIKPATDPKEIFPLLKQVDMVLPMTVEPGYGGQEVIPECLDKIRKIREYIEKNELSCDLEVDGGVREENLKEILSCGANIIVAGSAVFRGDVEENTRRLLSIMRE
ncbi:MAG: ribulose-phosphate 3-epimerase [Lachnospiraceae bacterium]|nr:ribulose-phosphate 3-epimerase [Lachnospiraceae bacterium]